MEGDDDMTTHTTNGTTPTEAREQLSSSGAVTLTTRHDRRVHGLANAGFGLAVGVIATLQQVLVENPGRVLLYGLYVVALAALTVWQTRGTRTVPRHARRTSRWGLAGTAVLGLTAITVLSARRGQAEFEGQVGWHDPWWLLALVALVVALPMLVAGHRIDRGDPAGDGE